MTSVPSRVPRTKYLTPRQTSPGFAVARANACLPPIGSPCSSRSSGGSASSRAQAGYAMQLWLERTVARWAARDLRWTQAIHRFSALPAVVLVFVFASRLANGVLWYTLMIVFPL